MRWVLLLLALAGCDVLFPLATPRVDALSREATHLTAGITPNDLTFTIEDATIDTSALTITPSIAGVELLEVAQDLPGPTVVVMQAGAVTITGTCTIVGSRPFAIVATTITITATGVVDGSANGSLGGPGANPAVPGAGGVGSTFSDVADQSSGGGGGGFAGHAGPGGPAGNLGCPADNPAGGIGGPEHGTPTLDVLEAGTTGGDVSAACGTSGGGGGGAVQLSAFDHLDIQGTIDVGGGGGTGGQFCTAHADGGAGGGSGGAIYVEAPSIDLAGILVANGGGGGGGGCQSETGLSGADGSRSEAVASGGATTNGTCGAGGGAGAAARTAGAVTGESSTGCMMSHGGGGGGAVGRIVVRGTISGVGLVSPPPTVLQF